MEKITWKNLRDKSDTERSSVLFLSFCRALEKYCAELGIESSNFSAVHILHAAAVNTISKKRTISAADVRAMNKMREKIPEMFTAIILFSNKNGYLRNREQMEEMSLAQIMQMLGPNFDARQR